MSPLLLRLLVLLLMVTTALLTVLSLYHHHRYAMHPHHCIQARHLAEPPLVMCRHIMHSISPH